MTSAASSGLSGMTKITVDISVSLDGYVAGPNQTIEEPLGRGGEELHQWIFGLEAWRSRHGLEGGERSVDSDIVQESVDATGAIVMGRRMFSGGDGKWDSDPMADGWWGDEPPFGVPVFVLTHHARETVTKPDGTTYTFVTDGIDSALEQARSAAGERNVSVAGGANVVQQYVRAGLLDELHLHVTPVLPGGGVRLFDDPAAEGTRFEIVRVVDSPAVTHLKYRVVK
jgi:dihydrofolate reductase